MTTTLIRQIPDDYAESTGLSKYHRSRMPGCMDRFVAAINHDGRFLTGIDENSTLVSKDKKDEVKDFRENLEKLTGKDLSGTSKFWETFEVVIQSDKPKTFHGENPMDVIALNLLLSNKYIAPSEKDAYTPDYRDAQYYAYTSEGEMQEETTTRKKRDRAIAELLTICDNKDKLILYGQYLEGLKYHSKLNEDTMYKMLRAYIEDKDIKNSVNFTDALKKSIEELQQKVIVDRALKQRLIVKTGGKKGLYQYGQVTLGNTLEDIYKNLSIPEFAPELMSIKKELDK